MPPSRIGLVSPGAMGAAVARSLIEHGLSVSAVLDERSERTRERAKAAGIVASGSLETLVASSDVVLSIVPPVSALSAAQSVGAAMAACKTPPIYVDANAVSPARARAIAETVEAVGARYVDGGIVGGPPTSGRETSLYLSGPAGQPLVDLFSTPELRVVWIGADPSAASTLKMAYAAWSKGTTALVLAIRALARQEGVESALLEQW